MASSLSKQQQEFLIARVERLYATLGTDEAVADIVGASQQTVNRIRKRKQPPGIEFAKRLSSANILDYSAFMRHELSDSDRLERETVEITRESYARLVALIDEARELVRRMQPLG